MCDFTLWIEPWYSHINKYERGNKTMYMQKYPCVYMRGGTSKAVFFHEKDCRPAK